MLLAPGRAGRAPKRGEQRAGQHAALSLLREAVDVGGRYCVWAIPEWQDAWWLIVRLSTNAAES